LRIEGRISCLGSCRIDPGSERRLHRLWFEQSAMGDLRGADYALVQRNALYRCLTTPRSML